MEGKQMALKVADHFAVDSTRYRFLAVQVAPKRGLWNEVTKTSEQQVNKDGIPVWLVEALRTDLKTNEAELVSVRIDSRKAPELPATGVVVFANLAVRSWSITDRESGSLSNAGISLMADGVTAA